MANDEKKTPREYGEWLKELGGVCPYRLDAEFNLYRHEGRDVNELFEKYCCITTACVAWQDEQCVAFFH